MGTLRVEKASKGRVIVREERGNLRLIIPPRRSFAKALVIVFLCTWLGGWAFCEIFTLGQLIRGEIDRSGFVFILFWLLGWTVGGIAVVSVIVYQAFGKEEITFAPDVVTVARKALGVGTSKRYAVSDANNLRLYFQGTTGNSDMFNFNAFNSRRLNRGTMAFDYGMKTVRFGNDVDDAEVRYLLDLIGDRFGPGMLQKP
jgi:hypothetical protein